MNAQLSRRVGKLMGVNPIRGLEFNDRMAFIQAVETATTFEDLDSKIQSLILQAETIRAQLIEKHGVYWEFHQPRIDLPEGVIAPLPDLKEEVGFSNEGQANIGKGWDADLKNPDLSEFTGSSDAASYDEEDGSNRPTPV